MGYLSAEHNSTPRMWVWLFKRMIYIISDEENYIYPCENILVKICSDQLHFHVMHYNERKYKRYRAKQFWLNLGGHFQTMLKHCLALIISIHGLETSDNTVHLPIFCSIPLWFGIPHLLGPVIYSLLNSFPYYFQGLSFHPLSFTMSPICIMQWSFLWRKYSMYIL